MIFLSTDIIVGNSNLGTTTEVDDVISAVEWLDNQIDVRFYEPVVSGSIVMFTLQNTITQSASCIANNNIDAIAIEQLFLQRKEELMKVY